MAIEEVPRGHQALCRHASGPGAIGWRSKILLFDQEESFAGASILGWPLTALDASRRTVTTAATSASVGWPRTTLISGPPCWGPVIYFDLPTPTPNCRWTRAQNASRSHSLASW
jgi:hypothetical protein